jgi:hypothetical protein
MSECSQCKKKGVSKGQIGTIVFGLYIITTAIYGTIQLVKLAISYFN